MERELNEEEIESIQNAPGEYSPPPMPEMPPQPNLQPTDPELR